MSQVKKLQSGGTVDATNTVDLGNYYKVTRTKNGDYLLNNDPTKQIIFNEKQEATIGGIVDPYLSKIQLKSDDNGNLLKGNQSIKFHTGNWVKIDGIDVPVTDELKSKIRESTNPTNYKSAEELNLVLDELGNGIKEINKNQLIVDPNSNYYRKSNVTRYSGKQYRQTKREAKEDGEINKYEANYLGDKTNFRVQRTNPLFGNRVAANLLNDITNSSSAVKEELTPKGVTTSLDTLASQVNKDFFTKGKGFYNEELWDVNKDTGERTWNKDKGTDLITNYFNNLQQIVTNPTLDTSKYTALLPQNKNFSEYVGGLKSEFTKNGFTPELGSQMDLLRQMGLYNYDKNKFKQYIKESSAVEQPDLEKEAADNQEDTNQANDEFKTKYNADFMKNISSKAGEVKTDDYGFYYVKDDDNKDVYFYKSDNDNKMIPSYLSPYDQNKGTVERRLPVLDTTFEFFHSNIDKLRNSLYHVSQSGETVDIQKGVGLYEDSSNKPPILGYQFPSRYSGINSLKFLLESNTALITNLDNLKNMNGDYNNNLVFKLTSANDETNTPYFRIENGRVSRYKLLDDGKLIVAPVNLYRVNDVIKYKYVLRDSDVWEYIPGYDKSTSNQQLSMPNAKALQSGGHIARAPKLDFTTPIIATKENMTEKGYLSDKRYKYSDEKTGGFDRDFTTNDYVALGSLVADLGSAVSGLVPGVGNVVSGGLGLAGSLGQIYLNANDAEGYDWGKELVGDAINVGLDLVSFIPVLGMSAKAIKIGKIGKNIHKSSSVIKKVIKAVPASMIIASGFINGQDLLEKLDDPNHEFGTEELLSIGRLLIAATNTSKLVKNARIKNDKSSKYKTELILKGQAISKNDEGKIINDLAEYSTLKAKGSDVLTTDDSKRLKDIEAKFVKNFGEDRSKQILNNIDDVIIKEKSTITKNKSKLLDEEQFTKNTPKHIWNKSTYTANQALFDPSRVTPGIVKTVDLNKVSYNGHEITIPTKASGLERVLNNKIIVKNNDDLETVLEIINGKKASDNKFSINDIQSLLRNRNIDFEFHADLKPRTFFHSKSQTKKTDIANRKTSDSGKITDDTQTKSNGESVNNNSNKEQSESVNNTSQSKNDSENVRDNTETTRNTDESVKDNTDATKKDSKISKKKGKDTLNKDSNTSNKNEYVQEYEKLTEVTNDNKKVNSDDYPKSTNTNDNIKTGQTNNQSTEIDKLANIVDTNKDSTRTKVKQTSSPIVQENAVSELSNDQSTSDNSAEATLEKFQNRNGKALYEQRINKGTPQQHKKLASAKSIRNNIAKREDGGILFYNPLLFQFGGSVFPIDKRQSIITNLVDNYTTQPFVPNDSIKQTDNKFIKLSNTINNPIGITKYKDGGELILNTKKYISWINNNNQLKNIDGYSQSNGIETKINNDNNITNSNDVQDDTGAVNLSNNNKLFINNFKPRDPSSVVAKLSPFRSLSLVPLDSTTHPLKSSFHNKYNLLNDPTFNLPKLNSSSSSVIVPNTNPIVPTTTSISTPKYNNFDILSAVKGAVPEVVNLTTNWANRNIAKRQAEDVKRTIQGLQPAKVNYIEQGLQNYINKDLFGDQNAIKNLRNSMLITNTANSNQNRAYALAAEDKIGQYNTTVNNEFRKNILNTDAANQQIKDRNMQNRVAAFNTNMEKAIDFDMNKKLTTAGIDKQIVGDTSKMNILSGITLGNIINKGVNSITNDKYEQALEQYTNKYNNIIRTLKAKDSSMSDEELKTAATEQLKSTPVALELERLKRKYNTDNSSLSVSNYSKGGSLTLEEREYLIKLRKNLKITEENNKYLKKLLKIK